MSATRHHRCCTLRFRRRCRARCRRNRNTSCSSPARV
ncbi:ORFL253W.iORF4 [Human betaherpesvirus 5]|nr:ORFL253W.iORF4 [Human betaherpesvirus 5]QHX40629.1 ORFL253W.iORF4 [Human betaherpesvirus 5]